MKYRRKINRVVSALLCTAMLLGLLLPPLNTYADGPSELTEVTEEIETVETTEETEETEETTEVEETKEPATEETEETTPEETEPEETTPEETEPEETTDPEETEEPSEEEAEEEEELDEEELIDALELNEPPTGVYGSGSYQVNRDENDWRFYFEYFLPCVTLGTNPGYQTAGINRQNQIHVYLKKGETVYFGSSVHNSCVGLDEEPNRTKLADSTTVTQGGKTFYSTGADVVIVKPNGTREGFDVTQNGKGYIATHTQEKNGPQVNEEDRQANTATGSNYQKNDRYDPLSYEAEQDGEYIFLFHPVTGWNNSCNPGNERVSVGSWHTNAPAVGKNQAFDTVAAWDITVVGKDENGDAQVQEGRAWANYLALNSGAAGDCKSSLHLHVLTDDGYVYKVEFSEFVPWGFIFFANNMGFTTTGTTPYSIYHSFYDDDNSLNNMQLDKEEKVTVHLPYAANTNTEKTFRVFFNAPSGELPFRHIPEVPNRITDLRLTGISSGVSQYTQGGTFTFHAEQASSVSIELDIRESVRKMLEEDPTNKALQDYVKNGSGMIVLNGAVQHGENSFLWDGTDTAGQYIPTGDYSRGDIRVFTEEKVGEIHFPLIDAEGLYGGVHIQRLNGQTPASGHTASDIFYNNNPLVYGTIEGAGVTPVKSNTYFELSDSTRSYDLGASGKGGKNFFRVNAAGKPSYSGTVAQLPDKNISTLVRDSKEYIALRDFGMAYSELPKDTQLLVDKLYTFPNYHHEPVDSSSTSMLISCSSNNGGGNQAGIDIWTYYSTGSKAYDMPMDFAVVDIQDTGSITGVVFYDGDRNAAYEKTSSEDQPLKDVVMRLVDATGKPVEHKVSVPRFDKDGYFVYEDGKVVYDDIVTTFTAKTDGNGQYTFTGVPYAQAGTVYYVQAMLSEVQTEVLEYLPTTSRKALSAGYLKPGVTAIPATSGPDGTTYTITSTSTQTEEIFHAVYKRTEGETVFDKSQSQSVTLSAKNTTAKFKDIGYVIGVPLEFQRDYEVKKVWGEVTEQLSNITVEIYYWDPYAQSGGLNGHGNNRRTGKFIDRAKLSKENNWTYTWKNLDNRLQYYFIEYYTKQKDNGEPMYTDQGEERLVLIGGTLPIYSAVPGSGEEFYTLTITGDSYNGHLITEERKHYYGDGVTYHPDATSELERQTNMDNNALNYDVRYTLTVADRTNILTFTNSQHYDEREYYTWLNHRRELPNFVTKTKILANGTKVTTPVVLEACTEDHDGHHANFHIKGLTISSLDASFIDNTEGNSSEIFHLDGTKGTSVWFTPTTQSYRTGTGSRTYKVEYTVDGDGNAIPVKIVDGHPAPANPAVTDYTTYSWTLTIHVYDVQPDETFYYDPYGDSIELQRGLNTDEKLTWDWETTKIDGVDFHQYVSDESRTWDDAGGVRTGENAVLGTDIIRVPMYKNAVSHLMGTSADLVGIAYSPEGAYEDDTEAQKLTYWDTWQSASPTKVTSLGYTDGKRNGTAGNGWAEAKGEGGTLSAQLNVLRDTPLTVGQDHADYTSLFFEPNGTYDGVEGDVFYYKIVVFSEAYSRKGGQYNKMDATEGVEMYTYVRLKPIPLHSELYITKQVGGNMGDTSKSFQVNVELTLPEGMTAEQDITVTGLQEQAEDGSFAPAEDLLIEEGWEGTVAVSFWLQQGSDVVLKDLPHGIRYRVTEADYSEDGYSIPKYSFDQEEEPGDEIHQGKLWEENYAEGMAADISDTVTIRNERNVILDIGVRLDNTPYLLMFLPTLFLALPLLLRRRRWA